MMNSENLSELKTQLFDAPSDVKSAFNQICKYFDKDSNLLSKLKNSKLNLENLQDEYHVSGDPGQKGAYTFSYNGKRFCAMNNPAYQGILIYLLSKDLSSADFNAELNATICRADQIDSAIKKLANQK